MKLLPSEQILDYINYFEAKHRATLDALKKEGKTYRTRDVTREIAYINILRELQDVITQPQKEMELREAMSKLAERLGS